MHRNHLLLVLLLSGSFLACVPAIDRDQIPGPSVKRPWAPPVVEEWSLDNGLKVWLVEQRHTSLASMALVLPSGTAMDPRGKEGLTSVMTDMLDEGAGQRSALDLSKELQRIGTDYGVSSDLDTMTFVMDLLPEGFEASLSMLADILRRPTFPKAEFERRKEQALARNISLEAVPSTGRARAIRYALFGNGYGGFRGNGLATTLSAIGHDDVVNQYKRLIAPHGATLILVGALSRAEVEPAVNRALADWQGVADAKLSTLDKRPAKKPALYLIDYPGAQQSAIAAVAPASGYEDVSKRFDKTIYSRILAGAFSSRINMNLREDKGYTYGARGGFGRFKRAGYFAIGASVKTDTTLASLVEIGKELRQAARSKPLAPKEVAEAKEGLLLGYPNRFEKIASVAAYLVDLVQRGIGLEWLKTWRPSVSAVTRAGAQQVAQDFSDMKDYVLVVAGDRARIETSLKSLGLPIIVCGKDGRPAPAPASPLAPTK